MIICWKSTYKIGDIEIDEQHQALVDKANAFMASIDKPMLDACATAFYEYSPYATSKLKRFGDYPTDLTPEGMPTRMTLPL